MAKAVYIGAPNEELRAVPDGYTRISGIHSDGNSFINTGRVPTKNTRIIAEFTIESETGWLFGANNGTRSYGMYVASATRIRTDYFSVMDRPSTPSYYEGYMAEDVPTTQGLVKLDKGKAYEGTEPKYTDRKAVLFGDTEIVESQLSIYTNQQTLSQNLYIFNTNNNGSPATAVTGWLHSFKWYEDGVLVLDLIPCINSDGVAGAWDIINRQFVTSANSNQFGAGVDISSVAKKVRNMYIGINGVARKVKRGYIGVPNFEGRPLPSGYTQVEYIESSGTQWINTGFTPDSNTRVVADIETTTTAPSANKWVFGCRSASATQRFELVYIPGSSAFRFYFSASYKAFSGVSLGRLLIDVSQSYASINGVSVTPTAATFTGAGPIYICSCNSASVSSEAFSQKVRSFQIYDNGTLVRDFVPCKNSAGIAGLYDVVNNKFYTNAGSGTFAVGETHKSVARLFFMASGVETMEFGYTGTMVDSGVVTMSGKKYRLLQLKTSGTLTVPEEVNAEVWMCGGGASGEGNAADSSSRGENGGGGAYAASGEVTLSGSMVAVIGSGGATAATSNASGNAGGETSFAGVSAAGATGTNGGTGGGAGGYRTNSSTYNVPGTGDGISKYPFADSSYFSQCTCAGGGGGGHRYLSGNTGMVVGGGDGGTNGADGSEFETLKSSYDAITNASGAGGSYGGGTGGNPPGYTVSGTTITIADANGSNATYFGAGGGGAGGGYIYNASSRYYKGTGGAGYQGVIWIRIPVDQAA